MGTLYERIIDLCASKGVAGGRMCLDLGLSKSTLTDLKMGRSKTISTTNLQKNATYFGETVGYLLGQEEEKEKSPSINDELSESIKMLIELFERIPVENQPMVLEMIRAALKAQGLL